MAELPYLPLFTDAWVADTAHLTRVERGLYHDMLVLCWRTPGCRVPASVDWIARRLSCTSVEVDILVRIIGEFMTSDGNWITQKRLSREFDRAREACQKQRDRANARWEKEKGTCHGNACLAMPPTSTSTIEVRKKEPPSEVRKKAVALPKAAPAKGSRLPPDWMPSEADRQYAEQHGFSPVHTERIALDFRDYWTAKAGQGATKRDWPATWRTWVRREKDRKADRNGRNGYVSPAAEIITDFVQRMADLPDERDQTSAWRDERKFTGTVVPLLRCT